MNVLNSSNNVAQYYYLLAYLLAYLLTFLHAHTATLLLQEKDGQQKKVQSRQRKLEFSTLKGPRRTFCKTLTFKQLQQRTCLITRRTLLSIMQPATQTTENVVVAVVQYKKLVCLGTLHYYLHAWSVLRGLCF